MADIAAVFHWSLAELRTLTVDELVAWRNRAVDSWNRMNAEPEK